MKSCSNCHFFAMTKYDEEGYCKLNPPTVVMSPHNVTRTVWPTVKTWEWCGQYAILSKVNREKGA